MTCARSIAAVALATGLLACATPAKFDPSRPVVMRGNRLLGESYEQDGERMNQFELFERLAENERTRDDVRAGRRLELAGGLAGLTGVVLGAVSVGLWEAGRPMNWTMLGVGTGLWAVSLPIGALADRAFARAIATHNRDLLGTNAPDLEDDDALLAQRPPFRWTSQLGVDFGSKELAWVRYTNNERRTLRLNDGFAFRFGVTTFNAGPFDTDIKIGFKVSSLRAGDDTILWLTTPIEALEGFNAGPVRIAAGVTFHPAASLKGSGKLANIGYDFDPAVGAVFELRYQTALAPLRAHAPVTSSVGVRYEWLSLAVDGKSTVSGGAFGIFSQMAY